MLEIFIQAMNQPAQVVEHVGMALSDLLPSQITAFIQAMQPTESVDYLRKSGDRTIAFAEISAQPQITRPAVPAPRGWRSVDVVPGVTAYQVPSEDEEWVEPVLPSDRWALGLDGTRHPYISKLELAELMAHSASQTSAAQKYIWKDTWQGEGYSRERDQQGQLVANREGGADIHVEVSFDASVIDPQQPNLRVVITNDQDVTAQVTNLSAFLLDQLTGETIAREDFAQLPPTYEVTLTRNGGFNGTEMKILEPSGSLVFEYHVARSELRSMFPLEIEGINRRFEERMQYIQSLEAQGWTVMEVPPPS
jgi:hypothetical protein